MNKSSVDVYLLATALLGVALFLAACGTRAAPVSFHDQPAAGVINGKFYVAGGYAGGGSYLTNTQAYTP